jgi:hypothetical protein
MKPIHIFLILFTLVSYTCISQCKSKFTILPHWKVGDTRLMTVRTSVNMSLNEDANTKFDTSAIFSIKIVEATQNAYVLEVGMVPRGIEQWDIDFFKDYISTYRYLLVTDTSGAFIDVKNWESLVNKNKELKQNFLSWANNEKHDTLIVNNFLSKLSLPMNKEDILKSCQDLCRIFLFSYGETLLEDDTLIVPQIKPDSRIKGGVPVKNQTITNRIDNNRISIRYSMIYDIDKIRKLIPRRSKIEKRSEGNETTYSEVIYNKETGWIDKILIYNKLERGDFNQIYRREYVIE